VAHAAALTSAQQLTSALACALQLYAPLDSSAVGRDVVERFLYIFVCLAPGCRNQAAGWTALRAQRPAAPPPAPAAAAAASAPAAPPQPADDWGAVGADDWGGDESAHDAVSAAAGDHTPALDALAEALASAQLQGAAADAAAAAKLRSARSEAQPQQPRTVRPQPCASTLPEFYVAAVAEPDADGDAGAGGAGTRDAAAERAAQLAAEYAARHGGAGTAAAPGGDGDDDGSGGGEAESWAGEQYERASVRGVDRAYLKFQKRLRRCPEQCLRRVFLFPALALSGSLKQHDACTANV